MEILHCRLHHFDLQQELVSAEIFLCRFLQWLEVLLDQTKTIAMDALNSRVVVLLSLVLCFQAKKVKLDIMVSKETEMKFNAQIFNNNKKKPHNTKKILTFGRGLYCCQYRQSSRSTPGRTCLCQRASSFSSILWHHCFWNPPSIYPNHVGRRD